MGKLAQLSGPAARVLLRFIELGGVSEGARETQLALGIGKTLYYRAKQELEGLGLIDRRGNLLPPFDRYNRDPLPPTPAAPAALPVEEEEEHDYYADLASGVYKPRQLAMLVDNLPWSGDPQELMRKNSPAQKRKRQQVPALQAIVLYMTGWKISDRNAKDMLTAQSELVEDVYEIVKEVYERTEEMGKVPETPGSYLVGACRRRQPAIAVGPVRFQPPVPPDVDPGPQPDEEFHDPRSEARVEEMRKLLAAGKMRMVPDGWDEDDYAA